MRRTLQSTFVTCLLLAGLVPSAAASDLGIAPDDDGAGPWAFSVDGSFGGYSSAGGVDYSVFPYVSYYVGDRVRLDGAVGLGWSDRGLSYASLSPGARYYLYRAPGGRMAVNSGGMLSFEVYEHRADSVPHAVPMESENAAATVAVVEPDEELFRLRLVPVELELWLGEHQGFSLGLDWRAGVYEGFSLDGEGLGLVAGYRVRF